MNTRTNDVIIGVDVGTTAVKVAAFAVNGRLPSCQSLIVLRNCATPKCWQSRSQLGGITLRWAGETFAPDLVAEGHADVDVLKLAA